MSSVEGIVHIKMSFTAELLLQLIWDSPISMSSNFSSVLFPV